MRVNPSIDSDRTTAAAKIIIPCSKMTGGLETERLEGF